MKFSAFKEKLEQGKEIVDFKENVNGKDRFGRTMVVTVLDFADGSKGYVLQRIWNADKEKIVTEGAGDTAVLGQGWEVSASGFVNNLRASQGVGAAFSLTED